MMLGMGISLLFTSAAVLSIGKAIEYFIDNGISQNNTGEINFALVVILLIVVVLSVFTFLRFFFITLAGERIVADMRLDIFKKILNMSPGFYESKKVGDVISNFSADTTLLLSVLSSSFSFVLRNIVLFLGGAAMLVFMSPKLTFMTAFLIPIVMVPIIVIGRKVRVYSKRSQDKLADLTSASEETLYGIKTIQSYVRESFEIDQFVSKLKVHLDITFKRIIIRGIFSATIICLVFGGVAVVLWYGAIQVTNGTISPGELSGFIYLAVVTSASVGAISEAYGELQKAMGAIDRIFEFLDAENTIFEVEKPQKLPCKKMPEVEFKKITFAYESGKNVFEDFSLQIKPGQINALVGKSGAGKSTLFSLIERFYDVQLGEVLVNGVDIKCVKLEDLRKLITYVPQEPIIFSGTVYENILYGNLDASREEVFSAAKAASALEFIEKMPQGMDSDLGSKGVKLSGGQKQRISIARAILSDPKLLLLDEATSALDSENEQAVQEALYNLMKGRTTIVIAHRLSTIKNADKIIVIGEKKVLQQGSHESLKSKKGLYSQLLKLQFKK